MRGIYDSVPVTLLNDILADPAMQGTAVIVNEFGAVPIDHDLVRKGSETYFRTTTGCICCTATSDIRSSLSELDEARLRGEIPPVSQVVIETTGLADPAPIINSIIPGGSPAMELRDHVVARHFHLARVVATFDVLEGRATLDSFMEGWKQLAFADHVVLTKTDLQDGNHDWPSELRALNPAAVYRDRHRQDFNLSGLFGDGAYSVSGKVEDVPGWLAMKRLGAHSNHAHDPNRHGDEIEAVSVSHAVPLSPQAVDTFLHIVTTNIGSGLLRLKGLFALTDDPTRPLVAHAVQHRLYPLQRLDHWPDEDHRSRVVLIGQEMLVKQIRDLFYVLAPRDESEARCGMSQTFVNPLSRNGSSVITSARAIKFWVRQVLKVPDDAVVSVSELACHVPGCPPKETVILVMQGTETVQASVHKPIKAVTEEDVAHAFSASTDPH